MQDFLRERWPAIVLAAVVIVFIGQNRDETNISFLMLDVTWPLWLTLTVVTLVGIVIGGFLARRRAKNA